MQEANSLPVALVGYDISPLSKYRNPWVTEGESIYNPLPYCTLYYI